MLSRMITIQSAETAKYIAAAKLIPIGLSLDEPIGGSRILQLYPRTILKRANQDYAGSSLDLPV